MARVLAVEVEVSECRISPVSMRPADRRVIVSKTTPRWRALEQVGDSCRVPIMVIVIVMVEVGRAKEEVRVTGAAAAPTENDFEWLARIKESKKREELYAIQYKSHENVQVGKKGERGLLT